MHLNVMANEVGANSCHVFFKNRLLCHLVKKKARKGEKNPSMI